MKKSTKFLIIILLITNLTALLTGYFIAYFFPLRYNSSWRRDMTLEQRKRRRIYFVCKHLNITDQKQIEQITPLIVNWLDQMEVLRLKSVPEYRALYANFTKQILPLLNDKQKLEFEKMCKKLENRLKRKISN